MDQLRCANIGILVGALIAVVGAVVFRGSGEAALELVGFGAFISSLAVYLALDTWAVRRGRKPPQ